MFKAKICLNFFLALLFRISVFSFVVEENLEKPTLQFVGEDNLTYVRINSITYNSVLTCHIFWQHFHVIGRCIGQQTPECSTGHSH